MPRTARIAAAFILCGVCALIATLLWRSSLHLVGPAYADAIAFAMVGFKMLSGGDGDPRVSKRFKDLLQVNACACAALFLTIFGKPLTGLKIPNLLFGFACFLAVWFTAVLIVRGYRKLNEAMEPFGPRRVP